MASRGATIACIAVARRHRNHLFSLPRLNFLSSPSRPSFPHILTSYPLSPRGDSISIQWIPRPNWLLIFSGAKKFPSFLLIVRKMAQFLAGFRYPIRGIHKATAVDDTVTGKMKDEDNSPQNWKIKMLYDGDCPLCMREVDMLRERNKSYGTIKFVDISSDEYSPENNQGLDYETVMGRIHAILSDGTVVTDVEAFRRLYEQVGLGWIYAITKHEPFATIADAIYGVWAKYRLQITGRQPLEEILEARKKKGEACNDSNACKM